MLTLARLENYLKDYLNTHAYPDYCHNGVQVEGRAVIRKVAISISASLATIEVAKRQKADALIVHHGLFWNKDPHPIVGVKRKKLALLLQGDISLLAYHLPLDAHPDIGNNWRAAKDLGFQELDCFEEIGVRGTFAPLSIEAFVKKVERYYGHKAVTSLGGKKIVRSAALISGGAHREIGKAVAAQVDCFLTGSFDEPIWDIAREEKIHFLALGHAATEQVGPKALGEHLKKTFGIEVFYIKSTNPF